eukprot:COSAG02_NODE_68187_length_251_cov_0.677632_1_plen_25_part_01
MAGANFAPKHVHAFEMYPIVGLALL